MRRLVRTLGRLRRSAYSVWQKPLRVWKRRLSPTLGDRGETAALCYLLRSGWDVLARNVHIGGGELDIIAFDAETLVFVEVKTRSRRDNFPPQTAVHKKKEETIVRLAEAFCHRYGLDTVPLRFDVVAVTIEENGVEAIQHFKAAF